MGRKGEDEETEEGGKEGRKGENEETERGGRRMEGRKECGERKGWEEKMK